MAKENSKRGSPYDGRFWYLNFIKLNNSSDSSFKHSTLDSKYKTLNPGQENLASLNKVNR